MSKNGSPQLILLIPTRNRRKDLTRLFESFLKQTILPHCILIIDGSDQGQTVEDFPRNYRSLSIEYLRIIPPGLTKQRNAGLDFIKDQYDLIGFLDDDLELLPDAVEKMLLFWKKAASNVGGASFNIINNEPSPATFLHRFFLISNKKGGTILPSGSNVILHPVLKDTQTQWLSGGATVWRKEIFEKYRFEEKYGGYGSMDDLDFCFSMRDEYTLMVLKDARVLHHLHPVRREKMKQFGQYDAINRYRFVKRFQLSKAAFAWATTGRILAHSLTGLIKRDTNKVEFAKGYLKGVYEIIKGTDEFELHDVKN